MARCRAADWTAVAAWRMAVVARRRRSAPRPPRFMPKRHPLRRPHDHDLPPDRHRHPESARRVDAQRTGSGDARPFAGGDGSGVHGLAGASRQFARQAAGAAREGAAQADAPAAARNPARPRRVDAVHRTAAAGRALQASGLATAAVPERLPIVPAAAAVVVERDDRRPRREPAPRGDGDLLRAPVAGHVLAVQLPADQPGGAGRDAAHGRHEPRPGRRQSVGGRAGPGDGQAASGGQRIPGREEPGTHAGQGHPAQPAHRTDPVRAARRPASIPSRC